MRKILATCVAIGTVVATFLFLLPTQVHGATPVCWHGTTTPTGIAGGDGNGALWDGYEGNCIGETIYSAEFYIKGTVGTPVVWTIPVDNIGARCVSNYKTVESDDTYGSKIAFDFFGGCTILETDTLYHQASSSITTGTVNGGEMWFRFYDVPTSELDNTETRIVSMTPENGTTTATTTVDFGLHLYINPDDVGQYLKIHVNFQNINQNTFIGGVLGFGEELFSGFATTSGDWYFNTTLELEPGNYRVYTRVESWLTPGFGSAGLPVGGLPGNVFLTQNNQFIVVESTFLGNISQNLFSDVASFFAGSTATSSESLGNTCNMLSGNFSIASCLAYLFIPDSLYVKQMVDNFMDTIGRKFPLGYVTDIYSILTDEATSTLPVLSFTVPSGIPGTGTEFEVSIANSLDFILYADIGEFVSPEASSTVTFYDYTKTYWEYLVYISVFLYIMFRIFGPDVVPFFRTSSPWADPSDKGRRVGYFKTRRLMKKGDHNKSVIH